MVLNPYITWLVDGPAVPFVNCFTSRGGTSNKMRKARKWLTL